MYILPKSNIAVYNTNIYLFMEFKQRVYIWICITDSLCCTPETNTTL